MRKLRVQVRGYYRSPYRRKTGISVRGTRVRPHTKLIPDVGAPGRGRRIIRIKRKGALQRLGYSVKASPESRRRALRKAVARYGERPVLGMLQAQVVFRKRTDGLRERFASDRTWVAKSYGTYKGKR